MGSALGTVSLYKSEMALWGLITKRSYRSIIVAPLRVLVSLGILIPLALIFCVVGPEESRSESKSESESRPKPSQLTRLRVIGKPKGEFYHFDEWRVGNYLMLGKVDVEVRNVGDVTAENITVTASVPSGGSVNLRGPASLTRNTAAHYSAEVHERVKSQSNISAKATCSNCR